MRCSSCDWVLPVDVGVVFDDGEETSVDPVRAALVRSVMESLKVQFGCPFCDSRVFVVTMNSETDRSLS